MCSKSVFLLTSFSLLLILSLTPLTATALAEGTLEGKKILMVIAQQDFRDEELFEPKAVFEGAGASVFVAAPRKETATGMLGGKVQPDFAISGVNASEFDAVVVVGGSGSPKYLWDDTQLRNLVKDAYAGGKVVAAICLSPVVLARAGILKGKSATVFPSSDAVAELKKGGAIYKDESVVIAGRIVTGRDPASAEAFANAIASLLRGEEPKQTSQPTQQLPSPKPAGFELFYAVLSAAGASLLTTRHLTTRRRTKRVK
ncbi:MAG: DJ-1/PfpI/YhbO family deglycase/protease [Candidatus Methanospirare jalkutatii]|nr:DJ-1/PfpI/YhbO family deglycase/protease [Candidatus Methanospirare jalkutatii]